MDIGQARGDLSLRQTAAKQKMLFFGHVMQANGLEMKMILLMRRTKEERSFEEGMDGGNTHDVWDGPCAAEGCGGGSRLMEKNYHDGR